VEKAKFENNDSEKEKKEDKEENKDKTKIVSRSNTLSSKSEESVPSIRKKPNKIFFVF
jgi:hypothetical protein